MELQLSDLAETRWTVKFRHYVKLRKALGKQFRALFIVDQNGVRYIDCEGGDLPFGRQLVDDVLHRTETAMSQAHCFLAAELALRAQKQATAL